ncbi:MAG: Isoquinoline 1-oxidoreductase subunit [Labilithrix sp.]|nr:Isoquinoline 1-oxidoreductase subunit [Labilithrix sp.]MCW5816843.1 Isoquinoline 1-oxidoreductase subunit [Labilithrix sp.]
MLRRSSLVAGTCIALVAGCRETRTAPPPRPPVAASDLRAPGDFSSIADRDDRARAMFVEASKVFLHPRCSNCHPAGDMPLQGDDGRVHDPPVVRGPSDEGVPALGCTSCHQDRNLELSRVPGAPKWQVAPRSMAWVGKTPGAICEQLKDRALNGGRDLNGIVEHVAHDELVRWGWSPGHGRTAAPGTQARFAALVAAWADAGAACPRGEKQGEKREEKR